MKKYETEIDKKNIDIPFPQSDHVAFTEALHCEDRTIFNLSVNRMLEFDKIKNMLIGQ